MTKNMNEEDPCNKLKENGKEQRAFGTVEGILVCHKDPEDQRYRSLVLLDSESRIPIAINKNLMAKIKEKGKK